MKNTCLITLLFAGFIVNILKSQNLVPNPSFEDTINCPDGTSQVTKAKYWNDLSNTPDYFNACSIIWEASVPENFAGYQDAHTGVAYMGMYCYSTVQLYREIIGANLLTPLTIGQKYYVNLKACMGYRQFGANTTAATNKLGVLLTTQNFTSNPPPINNYSQVYFDSIVIDSINWVTLRGSFIADSAYTHICIGNFFDDAHTDTIHLGFWTGYLSYYYIDDVCISTDSLFSEVWTSIPAFNKNQSLNIFHNPVNDVIHIENIPYGAQQIDIININGKIEYTTLVKNSNTLDITITYLTEGLYIAILRKGNEIIAQKKFIKSKY